MNLEGIPHYEVDGRIYFSKASHRELAMAREASGVFIPYRSTKVPGGKTPRARFHWKDYRCIYGTALSRDMWRRFNVDGAAFEAVDEELRCHYCNKAFQGS